jgi:hypothetical protein
MNGLLVHKGQISPGLLTRARHLPGPDSDVTDDLRDRP